MRINQPSFSETLLYWLLTSALLVFTIYVYVLPVFPAFNYMKDILILLVGLATLVDTLGRPLRRRIKWIDLSVSLLLVYLLFQLIYTAVRIGSLSVAYLGFRLDFSPIIFYFGFRRLQNRRYRRSFYTLFIMSLIVAVGLTLCEFSLVASGLVPQDFFWNLAGASEVRQGQSVGYIPRIYGMLGTPHATGLFNLVLLALLLYWSRSKIVLPVLGNLAHRRVRGGLMLLSLAAVFISTSKTAWLILPIVAGLAVVSQHRIRAKTILSAFALTTVSAVFLFVLVFHDSEQQDRVVNQLILGTFDLKQRQIEYWMKDVLRDSPIIGYGYAYDTRLSPITAPNWTDQNTVATGDAFFINILRMFGIVGALLLILSLGLLPLRVLFSLRSSREQKGAALGVLAIAIAFAHYPPLTHPLMALTLWYLMSMVADFKPLPELQFRRTVSAPEALANLTFSA